jgi:hypothetical protein
VSWGLQLEGPCLVPFTAGKQIAIDVVLGRMLGEETNAFVVQLERVSIHFCSHFCPYIHLWFPFVRITSPSEVIMWGDDYLPEFPQDLAPKFLVAHAILMGTPMIVGAVLCMILRRHEHPSWYGVQGTKPGCANELQSLKDLNNDINRNTSQSRD